MCMYDDSISRPTGSVIQSASTVQEEGSRDIAAEAHAALATRP
jgi:hypothetical protein